jgi:hypothetical protein
VSAGTRVYSMRLPDDLIEDIQADLELDNVHGIDPAVTLTTWMVRAARQRLAHRARSRAKRRKRIPRDEDGWPLVVVSLASREEGGE